MSRVRVASVSDLAAGELVPCEAAGFEVCLARIDGQGVFAVEDVCPHEGAPLSDGDIIETTWVQCPWHGSLFDLTSGAVTGMPATSPVRSFAVSIEGDDVFVDLPDSPPLEGGPDVAEERV